VVMKKGSARREVFEGLEERKLALATPRNFSEGTRIQ